MSLQSTQTWGNECTLTKEWPHERTKQSNATKEHKVIVIVLMSLDFILAKKKKNELESFSELLQIKNNTADCGWDYWKTWRLEGHFPSFSLLPGITSSHRVQNRKADLSPLTIHPSYYQHPENSKTTTHWKVTDITSFPSISHKPYMVEFCKKCTIFMNKVSIRLKFSPNLDSLRF